LRQPSRMPTSRLASHRNRHHPVGAARPVGITVSPDGTSVYVTIDHGDVKVISTATNTVTGTFPVGRYPAAWRRPWCRRPRPRSLGSARTVGRQVGRRGASVTITGTGLAGATAVHFGAVSAKFTAGSMTTIATTTGRGRGQPCPCPLTQPQQSRTSVQPEPEAAWEIRGQVPRRRRLHPAIFPRKAACDGALGNETHNLPVVGSSPTRPTMFGQRVCLPSPCSHSPAVAVRRWGVKAARRAARAADSARRSRAPVAAPAPGWPLSRSAGPWEAAYDGQANGQLSD
jgi:YVTN family beta-propeller protein